MTPPSAPARDPLPRQALRPRATLRLWPGVVLVLLQWALRFGIPRVAPDYIALGVLGGLGCGLAIFLWWAFFSRAAVIERVGGIVLMIASLLITFQFVDTSISTGMMGFLFPIYAIPTLCLAFVAWAVSTRHLPDRTRRLTLVAAILFGSGLWLFLRTDGVLGDSRSNFAFRWSETAEDRLLATSGELASDLAGSAMGTSAADPAHVAAWPGFRGARRDSIVHGVRIATDWTSQPPQELWRRPIGPGWSSFAVQGSVIYTQEQRGDDEVVSAYDATTGEPVWQHADRARFWESQGGAGPRATPTLHAGRVYTFGATGILNALDAATGNVVWSRNAAEDMSAEVPEWAFSSSPLILETTIDGTPRTLVLVDARGLIAYDATTGDIAWKGTSVPVSYSSPHLATLDGVEQILLLNNNGIVSVTPDGSELWQHEWDGFSMTQPAFPSDGRVLIGAGQGVGMRSLAVQHLDGAWQVESEWDSIRLKPYFNDLVLHHGHAYGFDGGILAAMDVSDGSRTWKGGRYGHGQLVLLADQDVLLVLTEKGDLALVSATPDGFEELARVPAIEGKTWNHPVLVGDLLLVRNGEEMAAFRVTLEG